MNSVSGFYFDTINAIEADCPREILEAAFSRCSCYEKLFNRFDPCSDVSRINRAEGRPVTVSDETVKLLKLALHYHAASGGAFDPTLGALSSEWKRCLMEDMTPDEDTVREKIPRAVFGETRICGNEVMMPAGLTLDLGGIAKGYIEDRIADDLRGAGIRSGLLNFGGNIVAIGGHPGGEAWRIGLRTPFGAESECWAVAGCRNAAISTSGTYERGKTIGGRRYHHILDPATGFPADNGILSVSVFSQRAADADALSTTFFVAGPEKGARIVKNENALFACLMADGRLYKSPELKLEAGWNKKREMG